MTSGRLGWGPQPPGPLKHRFACGELRAQPSLERIARRGPNAGDRLSRPCSESGLPNGVTATTHPRGAPCEETSRMNSPCCPTARVTAALLAAACSSKVTCSMLAAVALCEASGEAPNGQCHARACTWGGSARRFATMQSTSKVDTQWKTLRHASTSVRLDRNNANLRNIGTWVSSPGRNAATGATNEGAAA